jgi:uncharacterized protein YcaQ
VSALRRIDRPVARRLAIAKQRLSGTPARSSPAKVLDVLRAIRCVQLDPISVVARSPMLVLRSRLAGFDPAHLDGLVYRDRSLFEYWAHAASIVLTEDFAIHRYRMRTFPGRRLGRRYAEWCARTPRCDVRSRRSPAPVQGCDLEDRANASWVSC